MKRIVILISLLSLFSCEDKPVLLPQVDHTVLSKIEDHSPIYMFFKTEGKDTLIDVNRKNSISSTNWVFNIDKRLPLRLVIPELIKLQAKKDSIQKQLAFIPFTKLNFTLEKPKFGVHINFAKNSTVFVNAMEVKKEDLKTYLSHLPSDKPLHFNYCFDQNSSYGNFVKELVFAQSNGLQVESIFVY